MERIPQSPPVIHPLPDDSRRPLWSIMIPTYNCAAYIPQAIESVLNQDLGPDLMQIEVIDDCSTDANIEELVKKVGKGRVVFFRQIKNVGSLRNFETCINRAKGKYVHLLHGDDAVELNFYSTIESLFNKFPTVGAAMTNFTYIDEHGFKVPMTNNMLLEECGIVNDFLFKIARRQLIQPPAIVVKREVYEKLGSFYAVHFGEDWEMWARIASKYPVAFAPVRLAYYRVANINSISQQSFITGQNIRDIENVINIIQNYLPENKRREIRNFALAYYAIYCVKVANSLLHTNPKAAFIQVKGAFRMHKNLKTIFWILRFYLMHILRYKELEQIRKRLRINLYPSVKPQD